MCETLAGHGLAKLDVAGFTNHAIGRAVGRNRKCRVIEQSSHAGHVTVFSSRNCVGHNLVHIGKGRRERILGIDPKVLCGHSIRADKEVVAVVDRLADESIIFYELTYNKVLTPKRQLTSEENEGKYGTGSFV